MKGWKIRSDPWKYRGEKSGHSRDANMLFVYRRRGAEKKGRSPPHYCGKNRGEKRGIDVTFN